MKSDSRTPIQASLAGAAQAGVILLLYFGVFAALIYALVAVSATMG